MAERSMEFHEDTSGLRYYIAGDECNLPGLYVFDEESSDYVHLATRMKNDARSMREFRATVSHYSKRLQERDERLERIRRLLNLYEILCPDIRERVDELLNA